MPSVLENRVDNYKSVNWRTGGLIFWEEESIQISGAIVEASDCEVGTLYRAVTKYHIFICV